MSTAVVDYMYGDKVGTYYGYPPRNQIQTFHTPSFGDEEFDIPPINPHGGHHGQPHSQQLGQPHSQSLGQHSGPPGAHSPHQSGLPAMSYQHQMSDGLLQEHSSYQQPLYLSGPNDHQMGLGVGSSNYGSPQTPYIPGQDGQMLMLQQQQQHHHQMLMTHGHAVGPGQISQGPMSGMPGVPQYGRPAPAPGHSPPNTTTSEDSDDSAAMMGGIKRPSPEPVDQSKLQKKPKVQKKKKKRDPNEPQKPVSAYALFFRDTQAAIKGSNPNASFGEVSKIVASMWDALDSNNKDVYKKRTEAAKKDYLKALAAYRASLLSKGSNDQESNNVYSGGYSLHPPQGYGGPQPPSSGGYPGYSPPATQMSSPPMASPQHHQMVGMNKPTNGSPQQLSPRQPPPQTSMIGSPMGPGHMGHMGQLSPVGYMQQPPQQTLQLQPLAPMSSHPSQHVQPQLQQLQHPPQHLSPQPSPQQHSPPQQQQQPQSQQPSSQTPQQQPPQHHQQPCDPAAPQDQQNMTTCIRHGCPNVAVPNNEWEDEYCSNECVVSHCRDVFSSWVASNQNAQPQTYSTVK